MLTPRIYNTLLLLEGQNFIIQGREYQVLNQIRDTNQVDQEISYIFKAIPDVKGERWEMKHDRVDQLEKDNRIKYK